MTDPMWAPVPPGAATGFDTPMPVVTVVSPKGGSGKTMVSVNMAVALARRAPTVLVDLDVVAGDVEWALRSHPILRLDDLVRKVAADQITDIEALLTPHSTGVDALCAPESPVIADQLSPSESFLAIDRLINLHRPLVLDTASDVSPFTIGALDRATHVLLVSGTDVASVQAARKMMETMAKLAMDTQRLQLVVNKADSRTGLATEDVERALGLTASLVVPDLPAIATSVNRGVPFTESSPRSRVARRFFDLADWMVGVGDTPSPRFRRAFMRRDALTHHIEKESKQ